MIVSVCIPTYNSAKYVRECIESVLAQTHQDFELIISDNASTDHTWEIAQSYSDPRIRLRRADQNQGIAHNLNHAVGMACGEYLKILCSDDVLHARALELQAKFLDEHQDVVLVTSARQFIDAQGRDLEIVRWFSRDVVLRGVDLKILMLVYGNIIGEPSAVLMRRESLLKAGPFSGTLPQALDVDMWLRLAGLGKIGYLPAPLCSIWQHKLTTSNANRRKGVAVNDVIALAESLLSEPSTSWFALKVGWGRAAGSVIKQALLGMRYGYLRWPLCALYQAWRADPCLLGLVLYGLLFRPGLLGLRSNRRQEVRVCLGSTLWPFEADKDNVD